MRTNTKNGILLSLLIICFVLVITGCGKKGPPIAPSYKMPSSVTDLKGAVERDSLVLTWTVPDGNTGITGYIVYKSKTSVSEPECTTCPILFERVMDLPIMEKDPEDIKGEEMTYSETLEKGFRYVYKVNPYMEGGRVGKDSNAFVFTYAPDKETTNE